LRPERLEKTQYFQRFQGAFCTLENKRP